MTWNSFLIIAGFASIATAIPIVTAVFLYLTRKRRLKRKIKKAYEQQSRKPRGLVINVWPTGDPVPAIKTFLLQKENLDIEVEAVNYFGLISKNEVIKVLRDVWKMRAKLDNESITELYLFLKCPVAIAAAVGAILDNWVKVKVYHYDQGDYEFWTILHKGTVMGVKFGGIEDVLDTALSLK